MLQSQRPILFGVMKMAWILRFPVVWQGLNEELVVAGHVVEVPIKDQVSFPCFIVSCCYFVGSTEVLGRVGWVGETTFCCHLGRLFRYLNSMVTLLQECAVLPFFFSP